MIRAEISWSVTFYAYTREQEEILRKLITAAKQCCCRFGAVGLTPIGGKRSDLPWRYLSFLNSDRQDVRAVLMQAGISTKQFLFCEIPMGDEPQLDPRVNKRRRLAKV